MNSLKPFQQKIGKVFRCWDKEEYDVALKITGEMLEVWPGNAQLHILWANLVQLQDKPEHSLEEAKRSLRSAVVLEKDYPAGHIELGHYLDAVDDNPEDAVKAFAEGIDAARGFLIDGLLGQAKALVQLGKRELALKCVMESVYLLNSAHAAEEDNAEKVRNLLQDLFPKRTA